MRCARPWERNYRRRVERDESGFWMSVEGEGNLDRFSPHRVAVASPAGMRSCRGRAYEPPPDSARLAGLAVGDTLGAHAASSSNCRPH